VLFAGMALVWFNEMLFLGFQPLSKVWAYLWQVTLPTPPQLAAAFPITWAVAAPAKGALCVMAIAGLISKNPFARTALFVSMALVPPLNIAFPFRQQGFLPGPVTVATVLSTILWGSFFLFREPARRTTGEQAAASDRSASTGWDVLPRAWFAIYAAALSILALLLLFSPLRALSLILPCLSSAPNADNAGLSSLIHTSLASGTHMLAVATAFWIGTVGYRRSSVLRGALTAAGTVHAGLFLIFPLRKIALSFGGACAVSSILIVFVPLFVGWLLIAALSYGAVPPRVAALTR
jgi:hypothetical protein